MTEPVRPTRRWLRRHSLTLIATLGGAVGVAFAAGRTPPRPPPAVIAAPAIPAAPARDAEVDVVQIALVLDTSSSMNGLINQARSHLWKMVDDLGKLTRVVDGKVRGVRVELALFEYGNDTIPAALNHIRQVLPFSSDLDHVSEQLHALFTNGGSEYAGHAIATAVTTLPWSDDPAALRFVFVAGNESFDQGEVSAASAMAFAATKDITVQLIYCGDREPTWAAAAALAKSDLMTIDQNRVAEHIPAPQDDEILRLGAALNATYLAYGAEGQAARARQASADHASAKLSKKVAIERSQLKGKAGYKNERWDLVDAVAKDGGFLGKAADGALPAELRGKTLEEKQAMVAAKAAERARLKSELARLEAARTQHLAAEQARRAPDAPSLESEMKKTTTKAAAKKGYKP